MTTEILPLPFASRHPFFPVERIHDFPFTLDIETRALKKTFHFRSFCPRSLRVGRFSPVLSSLSLSQLSRIFHQSAQLLLSPPCTKSYPSGKRGRMADIVPCFTIFIYFSSFFAAVFFFFVGKFHFPIVLESRFDGSPRSKSAGHYGRGEAKV